MVNGLCIGGTRHAHRQEHNQGDQAAVIAAIEPFMRERAQYMPIKNNLQDAYVMMMVAYRSEGDYAKVRECASILLTSADPEFVAKGQANLALAALDEGDVPAAEKLRAEIVSEAAKLYLLACMQRVQDDPKQAIQTVTGIIADHANDVEWLAPSELLSAHLYLDMAMTNSAVKTARQVMNIYAGTYVSGDAKRFYDQLGGEAEPAEPAE